MSYQPVTNTAVQPVPGSPGIHGPDHTPVTSHGPLGTSDGTLVATTGAPDPELAELHAAVDQLAAAVAEHTAAIDAVQARIRALDGDGR